MGYPMAGHLVKAGHEVAVWNRTQAKSRQWITAHGGHVGKTIPHAVKDADFIFLCVGEDKDVYAVMDEVIMAATSGAIVVDHTTASSECARTCYENASGKGLGFVDAPVSGGETGAISGQLTIMCGGDKSDFNRADRIMQVYAKTTRHMGPSGAGQLTKMVNQICIAGILQGLAEGLHFARKAGLDVGEVVQAIGKGAAQSWQMDNRAATMGRDEYDFGFAVDWMRKDLGMAIRAAEDIGARLDLVRLVDGYYADVQNMGGNRWDTSSLLRRLT